MFALKSLETASKTATQNQLLSACIKNDPRLLLSNIVNPSKNFKAFQRISKSLQKFQIFKAKKLKNWIIMSYKFLIEITTHSETESTCSDHKKLCCWSTHALPICLHWYPKYPKNQNCENVFGFACWLSLDIIIKKSIL